MDKSNIEEDASMYLSFNSTMSASAYKTFEATQYAMDQDEACFDKNNTVSDDSRDLHMESTLEADNTQPEQLQTAKKTGELAMQVLSALPKNVLANFNALSSTPTKNEAVFKPEGNMQYVEMERSFGEAFDFKLLDEHDKGDKENVLPQTDDGPTITITGNSIIEQSVTKTPLKIDAAKLTEVLSVGKVKNIEQVPTQQQLEDVKPRTRIPNKNKSLVYVKPVTTNSKNTSFDIEPAEKVPSILAKPKLDLQAIKNSRKSVCEPDLKTNRPSRIIPKGRPSAAKEAIPYATASVAPSSAKGVFPSAAPSFNSKTAKGLIPVSNSAMGTISVPDAQSALPQLLTKMANVTFKEQARTDSANVKPEQSAAGNFIPPVKNLLMGNKRKSLLPMVAGAEKRQGFAQRMSTVVKTTLNSPARKIPRKSLLPSNFGQPRKSVATVNADRKPSRQSIMPTTSGIATKSTATGTKTSNLPTRQTLLPNTGAVPKVQLSKPAQSYPCNVCGSIFSIKSLLDAHKRSHEDGGTPSFVRKTQSVSTEAKASGSLMNPSNKCKFCDKKFALLRALHIHLMQNCPKIPPAEKRKLEFTEMNHVEKAQLPHIFNATHTGSVSNAKSSGGAVSKMPQKSLSNLGNYTAPVNSKPPLVEQKAISDGNNQSRMTDVVDMPPPQRALVAKSNGQPSGRQNLPHRGVFRTPNKTITCYICKTQFKTVLEYTNHSLEMHSSNN